MICKNPKLFFGKNSLNVTNVKLLSNFFFNVFGFFMHFWKEWQLALYILSDLPGIKHLNGLNDLNSLNNFSGLNDLFSLISPKKIQSLISVNPGTKVTYSGLIMWVGSSKTHYFLDF